MKKRRKKRTTNAKKPKKIGTTIKKKVTVKQHFVLFSSILIFFFSKEKVVTIARFIVRDTIELTTFIQVYGTDDLPKEVKEDEKVVEVKEKRRKEKKKRREKKEQKHQNDICFKKISRLLQKKKVVLFSFNLFFCPSSLSHFLLLANYRNNNSS